MQTKVYYFGMPTKTTKTTKSLVVVLRFCRKLKAEESGVRATQTTPSLHIACGGRNAHRAGPLLHGTRDAGVEKEKAEKAPGAKCPGKAFAPVACANRGQRAI